MNEISVMNAAANNVRALVAAMVEASQSGHPGGSMGGADFINVLFSEYLVYDPKDPNWKWRDRFYLDPGHMSPMLYSVLALAGKYSMDDLKQFRQWGSVTPGHPEVDVMRGVENTSGPLGQGHVMGVGAAIAERFLAARFGEWTAHKTYAYISDGGVEEEISQGAGRMAGHLGLSNFIMYYDSNNIQLSTKVNEVTSEDTAMKYRAWGWKVIEIDGSDVAQIRQALNTATAEKDAPTLIIGKTVMGKGAIKKDGTSGEHMVSTHGQPLSAAGMDLDATFRNIGADPQNPFQILPQVQALYDARAKELDTLVADRRKEEAKWAQGNADLAKKLVSFFDGSAAVIDYTKIVQKAGQATRAASATVLGALGEQVENMIVSSADLSNSDKTDGFLKKTKDIVKGDFSGKFLQAGVSELTMACVMNGIALHGGIVAACGTFFVFSDYIKPALRLSCLMQVPVKYIFTHDAFRVGEDGPTHQPIEHEAQMRLMEQLKNHHGQNAMLVLRPADVEETTVAYKMAMENTQTPTALLLSRQNIKDLPVEGASSRYDAALKASKGAYVVLTEKTPDVVLVGSGSEASLLCEAAALLKEKTSIRAQVVSAPSAGLFFNQDAAYKTSVFPLGVKVFGLTAGLPAALRDLCGPQAEIFGLDHFGYSAPASVLDQKFGFTAEQVFQKIVAYVQK